MIIKLSTLQQMLLEYLTSKGNDCCNLECCQISPTDKPLTMNSHLETKHYLVCETRRDHTDLCERWQPCEHRTRAVWVWGNHSAFSFAACIKCEFRAFPSNSLVLGFLNINIVRLLSVILNNGAQNNTSQISVTGKIFVV